MKEIPHAGNTALLATPQGPAQVPCAEGSYIGLDPPARVVIRPKIG